MRDSRILISINEVSRAEKKKKLSSFAEYVDPCRLVIHRTLYLSTPVVSYVVEVQQPRRPGCCISSHPSPVLRCRVVIAVFMELVSGVGTYTIIVSLKF